VDGAEVRLNRLWWLRFWLWWPILPLLFVASVVYGWIALFMWLDEIEGCDPAAGYADIESSYVPLRYDCIYETGTVHEVVPDETNLIVFGALGGAAACAGTALWLGRPIKRLKASVVEVPA
jgi:hypothetical protein